MVKDIENKFFEAFASNGVVDKCFKWIKGNCDLYGGPYHYTFKWTKEMLCLHNKLPQEIKDQAEKFFEDFSPLDCDWDTPFWIEISNNLDECQGDAEATKNYIYSLLSPFKTYSNIMHPRFVFEDYQNSIEETKKEIQIWEKGPESPETKGEIERCKSIIESYQRQIEEAKHFTKTFQRLLNMPWDRGTIEDCLKCVFFIVSVYIFVLDVELLKRGINLMFYQQAFKICLLEERDISEIVDIFGSVESTIKHIKNAKPKFPNNKNILPDVLNNDTAKTYFDKAIEYKLMDENYTWLKTKALLAQFCCEMSAKLNLTKAKTSDGRQYVSWKPFEALFNVSDLRGAFNDFQKKGNFPKDIDIIRKIFEL